MTAIDALIAEIRREKKHAEEMLRFKRLRAKNSARMPSADNYQGRIEALNDIEKFITRCLIVNPHCAKPGTVQTSGTKG